MDELNNGKTDIVVVPIPPTKLTELVISEEFYRFSEPVGHFSLGHIASVTKPGVRSEYIYFMSFEKEVWITLLLTLLTVGFVMSIMRGSIRTFFSSVWQLLTVLLSDYMTRTWRTIHEKIIVFFWLLLAGVVLFSAFTGCLWSFMIKKTPTQKIDSWLDLHQKWKDQKIITLKIGNFADFVTNDESEMARDFKSRCELTEPENMLNDSFNMKAIDRTLSGKYVFVFEYYALRYLGIQFNSDKNFNLKNRYRNGIQYHVSNTGGGTVPYFLIIKNNSNFTRNLNKA
jgi:hypothetical protein